MNYDPKPIDTAAVNLNADLQQLMERLAENVHDIWAQKRLADGWTHGPQRDDKKKQNPCLVPYNELPESEKEYDRAMCRETLKMMLALGYRIESPNK